MADKRRLLIIGASHAGIQTAGAARGFGYDGDIVVIGEEAEWPYHRPPLSKLPPTGVAAVPLRAEAFFQTRAIVLRLGVRANGVDRGDRQVRLSTGETLSYSDLVIATGASARLPSTFASVRPEKVRTLRTIADARAIYDLAADARKIVILGGGFVGLEAAAMLAAPGRDVLVIEAGERILQRAASRPMADFVRGKHQERGIRFLQGTSIEDSARAPFGGMKLRLSNGEQVDADLLIVGIGVVPSTRLASDAGLACAGGIVVDEHGKTEDPHVYAVGDCAIRPTRFGAGNAIRLESIHNATEMGKSVAALVAGRPPDTLACPWFWSDQWTYKIQRVGLLTGREHTLANRRGADDLGLFHFADDRLSVVETVDRPREHSAARRLFDNGQFPAVADVVGVEFDLARLCA